VQCIRHREKETWPELLSQHVPEGPKAMYENRSIFSSAFCEVLFSRSSFCIDVITNNFCFSCL
jgi:hypothetical protein